MTELSLFALALLILLYGLVRDSKLTVGGRKGGRNEPPDVRALNELLRPAVSSEYPTARKPSSLEQYKVPYIEL